MRISRERILQRDVRILKEDIGFFLIVFKYDLSLFLSSERLLKNIDIKCLMTGIFK